MQRSNLPEYFFEVRKMITKSKFDGWMPICPSCGKRLIDMSDEEYANYYDSSVAHESDPAMMYSLIDCDNCDVPYLVVHAPIKHYRYTIPYESWVAGVIFHDWTMTWDEYEYLASLRTFVSDNTELNVETDLKISDSGIVLTGIDPNTVG